MAARYLVILLVPILAGCLSSSSHSQGSPEAPVTDPLPPAASVTTFHAVNPHVIEVTVAGIPVLWWTNFMFIHEAAVTGYIFEAKWHKDNLAPQQATMVLYGTAEGSVPNTQTPVEIASVAGESTFRLVIESSKLAAGAEYFLRVDPKDSPVGVVPTRDLDVYVSTFQGGPMDPNYSGIPAA